MATIFTQTLTSNDNGWEDASLRIVVPITGGALDQVQVRFVASTAAGFKCDNVAIGISQNTVAGAENNVNDCKTTATPVELKFSGASGFDIAASGSLTSDAANLSGFTSGNLLVVILDVSNVRGNPRYVSGLGDVLSGGTAAYFAFSTNSYTDSNATGFSSGFNGWVIGFDLITTNSAGGGTTARVRRRARAPPQVSARQARRARPRLPGWGKRRLPALRFWPPPAPQTARRLQPPSL